MEKAKEQNVPLYMAFVDFKKAFDSVRHTTLWEVLTRMGVDNTVVGLLKSLYSRQQVAVRIEGEMSEFFDITKGVRQGCLMSPVSFNLYSEELMRRSTDEIRWVGVNVSGRRLNNLRYADDIVLISTSSEGLQLLVEEVSNVAIEFHLEISNKKTKVMAVTNEHEDLNIFCRGERLSQVNSFKYLGSVIEHTANCSNEIRARFGAARSAMRSLKSFWKDRALNKRIKLRMLRTLVWPVALYGCESWTMKADDIRRTKALEMDGYRRALQINGTARRTNDSVLAEMGTERLLVETVKKRKLQFFGHVIRAQNLTTHLLEGRIDGRRSRGRPRRRWGDDIKEWSGQSLAQCTRMARDRSRWRNRANSSATV